MSSEYVMAGNTNSTSQRSDIEQEFLINDSKHSTMSIIIPTYNRAVSLHRLLDHLELQTYPVEFWGVIVIDDGSDDVGYYEIFTSPHKYKLIKKIQDHQGAVSARNRGALESQAEILVFLDDDVIVEPGYLEGIMRAHNQHEKAVIMGRFRPARDGHEGPFKNAILDYGVTQGEYRDTERVGFTDCLSHNLSMKRHHFFEIGMFQDPTNGQGWSPWDDIDLGYRAYQNGFEFIQVTDAQGSHIDHSLGDFQAYCKRIYQVGKYAHWLFAKYPDLQEKLPMFRDKNPIWWDKDPLPLIMRKSVRGFLAWTPILKSMEAFRQWLERHYPHSRLLAQMYRWINSSYIYRGYHSGFLERKYS